ncbi:flagellar hook-length control protein FliK [Campylobacter sp. MIT 21-1685]|uniref:flagellar hook-length control protein FliK n=1 Tax=unclassified Campylobacter TaxID=2593542 RepID=UPI00224B7706|nr:MULTISPECIES: flagellar hook-length control protein FliK [unclassified Campylobacter]MCX2750933.1 flagellar hook-length control protein FliK [Campylobacter sp. MIT 21-1682]MCX2807134.1 flagellar hook-length control protein FliK [Campylobacter sp. MIT 21-1685]
MSNIVAQKNELTALSKLSTSNSHNKQSIHKTDELENSESFLHTLLKESDIFLFDSLQKDKQEIMGQVMMKLENSLFDENDTVSFFESASFMQILSLLEKLQVDTSEIKFNQLSNQITQILKSEEQFSALKEVSTLAELLDMVEDLGLELKNIKVEHLSDLKTAFPNLEKAHFFTGKIEDSFQKVISEKIADISKNIPQNVHFENILSKKTEKEQSLLSQILKKLDSLDKEEDLNDLIVRHKNEKNQGDLVKANLENATKTQILSNKENNTMANDSNRKNENRNDLNNNMSESKKSVPVTQKEFDKVSNKESYKEQRKDSSDLVKANLENATKTQILSNKENNTMANDSNRKNENRNDLNNNMSESKKSVPVTQKEFDKVSNKESYKEQRKDSSDLVKANLENATKTQILSNKENNTMANDNSLKEELTQHNKTGNDSMKNTLDELNSLLKDMSKSAHSSMKNPVKETLKYFSHDLKEAIEQYKAPVTKLSITLNPSNLGEVEVTLMQRGNNLHISFNSNTATMNIFIQNQTEFKNSLVNMGFTGLEMNFSDQGKKEQNQGKNRSAYGFKEALENSDEEQKLNLEFVLAKYF